MVQIRTVGVNFAFFPPIASENDPLIGDLIFTGNYEDEHRVDRLHSSPCAGRKNHASLFAQHPPPVILAQIACDACRRQLHDVDRAADGADVGKTLSGG